MNTDISVNPSPATVKAKVTATELNNSALAAERNGDLKTAERLHLEAISIKERGLGVNNPGTALSYNALGELYMTMKRFDDAEKYLTKAVEIRNAKGNAFDAAVSRENLAQLYEARGNFPKAKVLRLSGAPDKMACGYYQILIVPKNPSVPVKISASVNLKHVVDASPFTTAPQDVRVGCSRMIYQANDWKKRHKPLCKAA